MLYISSTEDCLRKTDLDNDDNLDYCSNIGGIFMKLWLVAGIKRFHNSLYIYNAIQWSVRYKSWEKRRLECFWDINMYNRKNKAFTIEENSRFGASVRLILKMLNLKHLSETWENAWVLFSVITIREELC